MVDNTNDSINIPNSEFNIVSSTTVDNAFNELSGKLEKIESMLDVTFVAILSNAIILFILIIVCICSLIFGG